MQRARLLRADVKAGLAPPSMLADELDARGLVNFDVAADRGDAVAAQYIQGLSDYCSPEAVRAAAAMRAEQGAGR